MKLCNDPQKDVINLQKHGVSLADAALLNGNGFKPHLTFALIMANPDTLALPPIGDCVYNVIFVDRSHERHIISLRKANKREVNRYELKVNS